MDATAVSTVASALAAPGRAAIACALMSGRAHTGAELGRHLGLAPSTMSEHLGILLDAGLLAEERQGRHRYVRLAGPDVADLVERLGVTGMDSTPVPDPKVPSTLRYARTCYDHLAGTLAVALVEHAFATGLIAETDGEPAFTDDGRSRLAELGVDVGPVRRDGSRPPLRRCLDWSERRHHVAGHQAAAFLEGMLDAGWFVRHPSHPRALRLTGTGRTRFVDGLGLVLPASGQSTVRS